MKLGPETLEQIAVIVWIRVKHPKVFPHVIHIANERKASKLRGYILKRCGLKPGASDLFIAYPNGRSCGLFVEMKSLKGRISPSQQEFVDLMSKSGYEAKVCFGAEQAIETISVYLNEQLLNPVVPLNSAAYKQSS